MTELLFVLFGVLAGIIGGMGMGGGTLLIPLLTIFLQFGQKEAQGLNLVCFLFLSLPALIFYFKNKMLAKQGIWLIILIGMGFAVLGSFLANFINQKILRICFGVFLILLSIWQFAKFFLIKTKQKD